MKLFTIIAVSSFVIFIIATKPLEVKDRHLDHPHKLIINTAVMDTVPDSFPYQKSEAEWKQILTSSQYRILRKKGTEFPYVNDYYDSKKDGIYVCAGCNQKLYDSEHKYKSGTGWPSFWKPIDDSLIVELEDNSLFMKRVEIVCSNCGGHLGHVFDDGPKPTGLRYCMNSAAMKLLDREEIEVPVDN